MKDDGGGLKAGSGGSGYGIMGMQERVASLGGRLEVSNRRDGQGVVVSAHLPGRVPSVAARKYETHEATLQ